MMPKRRNKCLVLGVCYAAVLLVWLLWCSGRLAADSWRLSTGEMLQKSLMPEDFSPSTTGIDFSDDWANERHFSTTDADAQLHVDFEGGARVGRVVFSATPLNKPGGEMALYYTTRGGQGFSEAHKLPAMQDASGSWMFDLEGRRVHRLRLDPDSVGGVYWQMTDLVLNAPKSAVQYYLPDALQMIVLMVLPLFVYALLGELVAFLQPLLAKRRLERRWKQLGKRE